MNNLNQTARRPKRPLIRIRKWSQFLALLAATTLVGPASAQGILMGSLDGSRPPDATVQVVMEFDESIAEVRCNRVIGCFIELEPGEELVDGPLIGDSRWNVKTTIYGREPETVVVAARPNSSAGDTTLLIPTDRRLYLVALIHDTEAHTSVVRFRWADGEAP